MITLTGFHCIWFNKIKTLGWTDALKTYIQNLHTKLTYKTYIQNLHSKLTYKTYIQNFHTKLTYKTYIQNFHPNLHTKLTYKIWTSESSFHHYAAGSSLFVISLLIYSRSNGYCLKIAQVILSIIYILERKTRKKR